MTVDNFTLRVPEFKWEQVIKFIQKCETKIRMRRFRGSLVYRGDQLF